MLSILHRNTQIIFRVTKWIIQCISIVTLTLDPRKDWKSWSGFPLSTSSVSHSSISLILPMQSIYFNQNVETLRMSINVQKHCRYPGNWTKQCALVPVSPVSKIGQMSDGGLSDINIAFLFIVSVSVIGVLAVNFAFIVKMAKERARFEYQDIFMFLRISDYIKGFFFFLN